MVLWSGVPEKSWEALPSNIPPLLYLLTVPHCTLWLYGMYAAKSTGSELGWPKFKSWSCQPLPVWLQIYSPSVSQFPVKKGKLPHLSRWELIRGVFTQTLAHGSPQKWGINTITTTFENSTCSLGLKVYPLLPPQTHLSAILSKVDMIFPSLSVQTTVCVFWAPMNTSLVRPFLSLSYF